MSECYSQNKDELIIRFETQNSPFFIKAALSPSFSCLSFPGNIKRTRRNSVNLFDALVGLRVETFRQFENERSFSINFNNNFSLLFKMHGNRSNIILFQEGVIVELFKNNIAEDALLNLAEIDRQIDWSYENFVHHHTQPEAIYFTFGKSVWKYLKTQHYHELAIEDQWKAIQNVQDQLTHPHFFIQQMDGKIVFSLLDFDKVLNEFNDPIEALTVFFNAYMQQGAFAMEKAALTAHLKSKLNANEKYLEKTLGRLHELERDNHYKVWADLIMANLYQIQSASELVTLPNFYNDNRSTEIKLKKDLSPQKNAAVFYKKAKNQQIEIHHLQKLIDNKKQETDILNAQLQQIEIADDLKVVRKLTETLPVKDERKKQPISLPYREVEFNGYKIWIGKNAQSNDTLTLKFSYKEDLWLHAKDVSGSHVLLKHQAGKNFPKNVIERAAQLAAYYSKRKGESLCPVSVTPRKFVRKRKGDPAGTVIVEREEVILVEPRKE